MTRRTGRRPETTAGPEQRARRRPRPGIDSIGAASSRRSGALCAAKLPENRMVGVGEGEEPEQLPLHFAGLVGSADLAIEPCEARLIVEPEGSGALERDGGALLGGALQDPDGLRPISLLTEGLGEGLRPKEEDPVARLARESRSLFEVGDSLLPIASRERHLAPWNLQVARSGDGLVRLDPGEDPLGLRQKAGSRQENHGVDALGARPLRGLEMPSQSSPVVS